MCLKMVVSVNVPSAGVGVSAGPAVLKEDYRCLVRTCGQPFSDTCYTKYTIVVVYEYIHHLPHVRSFLIQDVS
jgi:hypothetical protein